MNNKTVLKGILALLSLTLALLALVRLIKHDYWQFSSDLISAIVIGTVAYLSTTDKDSTPTSPTHNYGDNEKMVEHLTLTLFNRLQLVVFAVSFILYLLTAKNFVWGIIGIFAFSSWAILMLLEIIIGIVYSVRKQ